METMGTKPYDEAIDIFTNFHGSYVERAQKMIDFAKCFENDLKKTLPGGEEEILTALKNLIDSNQKDRKISSDLSNTAELLVKLAKDKRTQSLLIAIRTDFYKYRALQETVLELRQKYKKKVIGETSEYLSLHELVIGDEYRSPKAELLQKATLCLRIMLLLSADRTTFPLMKVLVNSFESDMLKAEQLVQLCPTEIKEAAFNEVMDIVSQLKYNLKIWVLLRRQTVDCLREMATDLHGHNRNVAISQTVASGTGILATAVGATGIALAPFTFGASLGLTVAGVALGGASAVTHLGSAVTKHMIEKNKLKTLEELISKETEQLDGKSDDKGPEQITKTALKERLYKLYPWVQDNKRLRRVTGTSTNMNASRVTLPVVYFCVAGSGALRIILAQSAMVAAGSATKVVSRVAIGIGGALSLIALPVDIINVVILANELKGGAKSAIGEEFDRMADRFETELKSIQNLIDFNDKSYKGISGIIEYIFRENSYIVIAVLVVAIVVLLFIRLPSYRETDMRSNLLE